MVKHYIPQNLKEALKILDTHDCYIMAGGTDLMVVKHQRSGLIPNFDKDVCYIADLKELQYITEDEKGVHIGAGTKLSIIEENILVPELIKQIVHALFIRILYSAISICKLIQLRPQVISLIGFDICCLS